jgi:hypothetical protein
MSHSNQLREFEKEFKNLSKKYRSLDDDFKKFERYIFENPTGEGKNFVIIYSDEKIKIVKTRLSCESLRGRSMRVIYSYQEDILTFMYIEIYFKGDKENEDRERIKRYLKNL